MRSALYIDKDTDPPEAWRRHGNCKFQVVIRSVDGFSCPSALLSVNYGEIMLGALVELTFPRNHREG